MAAVTNYRTKDGLEDYKFSIERLPDGIYRAYILRQPSYGSRSTDPNTIHRLSDGGRPYICVAREYQPRSEAAARNLISAWCDMTQVYIRTGETIDAQIDRQQHR